MAGASSCPARLDYGHIKEYLEDQTQQDNGDRDGTDRFYQEQVEHETRIGFLFQKLHRPRSYDYLKDKEKYKTWDDRLRMPQFAWANDPAAIEEVMTLILGLTGEKIGFKYLAKANYNDVQTALAKGGKVLNRYNCTGCHVLEMPKYSLPEETKVADAFTDFKANVKSSYTARNNDYLAELYPALTYDPKKKLDADNIEAELGIEQEYWERGQKDDRKGPITVEGMPIGLFENELTVQLWKPVMIRGYTFNVGDNVTLDQTKVQKTPAVGGNFAWLYSTTFQERTGTSFESFWNRLPPPLVREGTRCSLPLGLHFSSGTPTRSGQPPSSGCRDSTMERPLAHPRTKQKTWPTTSQPATGPSSPTRRSPTGGWLHRGTQAGSSRLPRCRLVDDGQQRIALHPVSCDRTV